MTKDDLKVKCKLLGNSLERISENTFILESNGKYTLYHFTGNGYIKSSEYDELSPAGKFVIAGLNSKEGIVSTDDCSELIKPTFDSCQNYLNRLIVCYKDDKVFILNSEMDILIKGIYRKIVSVFYYKESLIIALSNSEGLVDIYKYTFDNIECILGDCRTLKVADKILDGYISVRDQYGQSKLLRLSDNKLVDGRVTQNSLTGRYSIIFENLEVVECRHIVHRIKPL